MILHYGDLTDSSNLLHILSQVRPTEVYNLGAQSHVKVSFDLPEYTADVDALGTLRLLDAIRSCDLTTSTKFYQASTSELYGKVVETPQSETTPFYPRSPYGETVRLLDPRQLPGGVRDVCVQRDSVQPRVTTSRTNVCDPKDFQGCSEHYPWASIMFVPR